MPLSFIQLRRDEPLLTALPYMKGVHAVIWTATFLTQAKRHGLSEEEMESNVNKLADDPLAGDIMPGTGGARKLRHPGRGGGYRTIHHFGGDDVPVFPLAVYGKGAKADLTKAERDGLARLLPGIADACRANAGPVADRQRRKK